MSSKIKFRHIQNHIRRSKTKKKKNGTEKDKEPEIVNRQMSSMRQSERNERLENNKSFWHSIKRQNTIHVCDVKPQQQHHQSATTSTATKTIDTFCFSFVRYGIEMS